LSKVFFETVAVKEIDNDTNLMFENYLTELVNSKLSGQPTLSIQKLIDRKLANIYMLTDEESKLLDLLETTDNEEDSSIRDISKLVNS
jgi:hypothetical protein